MGDVLADAEAAHLARCFLRRRRRPRRGVPAARLPHFLALPGEPRREPLEELLRDLLEEARRDVVARLAVEHARLRVREVEAVARARDRHVREPALFFEAIAFRHALL